MSLIGWVDRVVKAIASAEAIDGPNAAIQRLSDKLDAVPAPPAYVHPKLVWIPVAAWGAAKLCDLGHRPRAAQALVAAGVLTAIPTMISGHEDWTRAAPALQRVASVHAALNNLAVYSYTASWFARGPAVTAPGSRCR